MSIKLRLWLSGKNTDLGIEEQVMRRIYGRKGDEIKGKWIKNTQRNLHNLHSSHDIIRYIK
jgi:hypothetical protein